MPFGVNILKSVCLLLSNLVVYFWDESNISKKVREIQSTRIHYDINNIYIYCPSRGLLGYPQHQLPLWPCAVFCYKFFTKNNIFLFQPHGQICGGRSRGPPHSSPKWWQPQKSLLCHHRIWPAHTLSSHCLGPTGDLSVLIWQPCVEKSSLQIQRCVLLERNMIPENSYLCFFT